MENICKKIVYIDSVEFLSNKQYCEKFDSETAIVKVDGTIKIPLKDSILLFRDNTTNESFFEYSVIGKKDNWILILGQDYNQDYYLLLNKTTNKIDTLIGYPSIFHNILLCVEGDYTDGTKFIELWKKKGNIIKLIKKVSLKYCDIYSINEFYFKDKYLYLQYEQTKYLKIEIL